MESGHAQMLPPPGVGKVLGEGKKKNGQVVPLQQDPEGTPCRNGGGGVCTKLLVGYT